jgi:hypothetical protein
MAFMFVAIWMCPAEVPLFSTKSRANGEAVVDPANRVERISEQADQHESSFRPLSSYFAVG